MKVSEEIARAHGMSGIVLTCFKHNPAALGFYRALGYVPAPHSPSRCTVERALPGQPQLHTLVQQEEADYEILCKMWSEEAMHTLEAVAEVLTLPATRLDARATWKELRWSFSTLDGACVMRLRVYLYLAVALTLATPAAENLQESRQELAATIQGLIPVE
eukprot:gene6536-7832_t